MDSKNKKPNKISRTHTIANEKFNGNIEEAIKYILWHYEYGELNEFIREWDDNEFLIANKLIEEAPVVNPIFEEETTKNPYTKTFWIHIITTAVVCVSVIFILKYLENVVSDFETWKGWAMGGLSIFITLQSIKIGPIMNAMFKYRKENKNDR